MLNIFNPANGRVLAELPQDTPGSVAAKYRAARAVQPAWAAAPLETRLAAIRRFREEIVRETERLAAILTSEVGKPIKQARNELNGLLGRIDFFLSSTESTLAPRQVFDEGGMREVISHEPLGVIANISAWNYPYFVGANVFVPALLTGNAVLYKPSEFATLTGLEIGKLLHLSGIPQDVFAVAIGAGEVGRAVLAQPVDGVFFTGSYATGSRIAQEVGPRMTKLQLELGGKDPTYVCEDVDVAAAATSLADGAMYNAGQSCCSVERIYVHERIHDALLHALTEGARRVEFNYPDIHSGHIGPLIFAQQATTIREHLADAVAKGAHLECGGEIIELGGGLYCPATVLSRVDHTMRVMTEETFGPVMPVMPFRDTDEAVRLANDSIYGLSASVFGANREEAESVARRINAGAVAINDGSVTAMVHDVEHDAFAFSGLGRSRMGPAGIGRYVRRKGIYVNQGRALDLSAYGEGGPQHTG